MECKECGNSLVFDTSLHGYHDLFVTVEPCDHCLNNVRIKEHKKMEGK